MKKKFFVELVKTVQYHVEAEDMDEAENIALKMDADKSADLNWTLLPYNEIYIEEGNY